MRSEMVLLYRLVFSASYRSALKAISAPVLQGYFQRLGWSVRFLDLDEVERFAKLTSSTIAQGRDRGGASLELAFPNTLKILKEQGFCMDEILSSFLESMVFEEFVEVEPYGTVRPLEEAFGRYLLLHPGPSHKVKTFSATVTHETLHVLCRKIASKEAAAAEVRHPSLRSTGCGMAAVVRAPRGAVRIDHAMPDEEVDFLYFAGERFVFGEIPESAKTVLEFAMALGEPDVDARRGAIEQAHPAHPLTAKLVSLGVI